MEAALTATSFEIGTRSINLVDRFGVYQKFLVGVLLPPSLKVSNNNLHASKLDESKLLSPVCAVYVRRARPWP